MAQAQLLMHLRLRLRLPNLHPAETVWLLVMKPDAEKESYNPLGYAPDDSVSRQKVVAGEEHQQQGVPR